MTVAFGCLGGGHRQAPSWLLSQQFGSDQWLINTRLDCLNLEVLKLVETVMVKTRQVQGMPSMQSIAKR